MPMPPSPPALLTAAASAGVLSHPMGACSMGQRMLSLSVKAFWDHMHASKRLGAIALARLAQGGLLAQLGVAPRLTVEFRAGLTCWAFSTRVRLTSEAKGARAVAVPYTADVICDTGTVADCVRATSAFVCGLLSEARTHA